MTEEPDACGLQKAAQMSFSQFQKTFLSITGMSVMEYVRKRRLSLAALEISQNKTSVLDLALKYGYDSAEGFSRAFKAFHGVTPRNVRGGKSFWVMNKISFQITVNGGGKMKFELTELKSITFTGVETIADGDMNGDIDKRWDNDDDAWNATRKEQNAIVTANAVWYEIYKRIDSGSYYHYICTDCADIPENCVSVNLEGGLFAKITTEKSKYPTEQLKDVYYSALSNGEWLRAADLRLDENRNQFYATHWSVTEKDERYIEIYLPVSRRQ